MRNLLLGTLFLGGASAVHLFSATGGWQSIWNAATSVVKEAQTAAIFFVPSITVAQIQNDYHTRPVAVDPATGLAGQPATTKKVRVLIVPGHQPDVGGTVARGLYERNVVVDIADALVTLLAQNSHYEVTVARTKDEWNPILQSYFDTHALEIDTFRQSQKQQMMNYLADGTLLPGEDQVYHNTAPSEAVLQLYGINKWASDNKYDITLHLHINDYAGRRANGAEKYKGFAIYAPDKQYSNAVVSKAIGESIAVRMNAYHATSTLPKEDVGVVEDQELIAIGSNNSTDAAALLIEYGYIYEPQFQESSVRALAIADYAFQTYLGLQDFFKDTIKSTYGSVSFPYDWSVVTAKKGEKGPGIYALQAALHSLGYYPPLGKSFSECPVSGVAGSCTRDAIKAYQRARGLEATGTLGPQTRDVLSQDMIQSPTPTISLR